MAIVVVVRSRPNPIRYTEATKWLWTEAVTLATLATADVLRVLAWPAPGPAPPPP